MIREIIKEVANVFPDFESLVKWLSKKLDFHIDWMNSFDAYADISKGHKEYHFYLTKESDGLSPYILRLSDDEGNKIVEINQKIFWDKDQWYLGDAILKILKKYL